MMNSNSKNSNFFISVFLKKLFVSGFVTKMQSNDKENENLIKQKNNDFCEEVDPEIIKKWKREQEMFKLKLKLYDTEPWQLNKSIYTPSSISQTEQSINTYNSEHLRYVAGFDISFVKDHNTACSGLFVFDLSDNMKLVYQDIDQNLIEMEQPYIPGFLAYREAPFLLSKLEKLKKSNSHLYPHVIMVDGNGILHPNKFGLACHCGLLSNTPTIGVSKKLLQVFGLENNEQHKRNIKEKLQKAGDYFELISHEDEPQVLAMCYKSQNDTTSPIYISLGNMISWPTCLWIVGLVTKKYRIPEPIRIADILTREAIKKLLG